MGTLSDLLRRANPANVANRPTTAGHDSQDSQSIRPDKAVSDSHDSQNSHALGPLRNALQQTAIIDGLPVDLVAGLEDADVLACTGLPLDTLRAYLRALGRLQQMAAGIAPDGWTCAAECAGCGPVLLWPDAPASVIACPWCWHRKAGRMIPHSRGD